MPRDRSSFDHLIGNFAKLTISRFAPAGAFLMERDAAGDGSGLLLLGREIPKGAQLGDELSVFVYLDSEGRPIATTAVPKLALDEVAFLKATERGKFGTFVDMGLPKELLVPFAEQTVELREGAFEPIALYVDDSGRLAGTMKVSEALAQGSTDFKPDEWVDGEAWRHDPEIGLFVIVERRFVGLVPLHEPHRLRRGEAARFRVNHVQPDGKLELSLRGHAHEELGADAERVLALLCSPAPPNLGDETSPAQIQRLLGISKKAFKRALGRLFKQRRIDFDEHGFARPRR